MNGVERGAAARHAWRVGALVALGLLVTWPATTQAQQLQRAPVDPLVEAEWLVENLTDPHLVVLHVGGSPEQFAEGHIRGAQHLGMSDVIWAGEDDWAVEWRSVDEVIDALRDVGVSQDSRVVVYGSSMTSTARIWVTFDWLGLGQQAFVLNGGFEAYEAAGGPVATGAAEGVHRGDVNAENPRDFRVSAEWIHDRLGDPSLALIDARPDDEYTGEDGGMGGMANPGHIPGARQVFWEELMDPDNTYRFRPVSELEEVLTKNGAGADKTHVSYCMVGLRASVDYMAARMLGWDVYFYDGSWHDWGVRDDVPFESGEDELDAHH